MPGKRTIPNGTWNRVPADRFTTFRSLAARRDYIRRRGKTAPRIYSRYAHIELINEDSERNEK